MVLRVGQRLRHDPVGGGLRLGARLGHRLEIIGDGARGRHDAGVLAAESVARDESLALLRRQLRQFALLLGDELRRQHAWRQIGLREIAVVVAFLFRALRPNAVFL